MSSTYDAAVAGWFADLRRGECSTWSEWLAAHPRPARGEPAPRTSSVQLELLRRLAAEPPPRFEALADLVVSTAPYGRGRGDVPLPWRVAPEFGPPAVAPEDLPAEELLRVAGPVLARLAARLPEEPAPVPPAGGRWWRRGVVVSGPPLQSAALRHRLLSLGLRDGGRGATRVVLVEPFERGMFDLWASRIAEGGTVRWRRFWQIRSRTDRVPRQLDAPWLIRSGADGRRRAHVVVTADHDAAARALSDLFGAEVVLPGGPDWAQTDLLRLLNRILETTATSPARHSLAARVLALASDDGGAAPVAPVAPGPYRAWANATGTRLAADLEDLARAGGYPVHGNIADLVGTADRGKKEARAPVTNGAEDTLAVALRAIRAAWARVGGRS